MYTSPNRLDPKNETSSKVKLSGFYIINDYFDENNTKIASSYPKILIKNKLFVMQYCYVASTDQSLFGGSMDG